MDKEETLHQYRKLLAPSLLSGAVNIFLPLLVVLVTLISERLQGSILQNELFAIHQASGPFVALYVMVLGWLDSRQYVMNIPIAIFWVVLGLVAYTIAVEVIRLFGGAVHIEHEIHYVHSKPGEIIGEVAAQLLLRVAAATALLWLAPYTFGQLATEQISAAKILALAPSTNETIQLVVITALFILSLCAQTALLRLLFLRVRLFGNVLDE